MPLILEEVGYSATPWTNPDARLLQDYMNIVYPGGDHVVQKGDSLDTSVS